MDVGAVCIKIGDGYEARIYPAGTYHQIDWSVPQESVLGDCVVIYHAKKEVRQKPSLFIDEGLDGQPILRIVETKQYTLRMECEDESAAELPHFQNESNKFLKCNRDKDTVSFQFINYLGRSKIRFEQGEAFPFEVVPDKIDYEDDYIGLTEAIAQICSELLLEYSGSTSNVFSQSEDDRETLLEQFIFLRQFCYGQNLQGLFEAIKRNPDRILAHEEELKPIGAGQPSRKFYINPFSYSRGWAKVAEDDAGKNVYLPQEVAVTRKYDSLDTPANRFLKFALQKFDSICLELIGKLGKDGQQTECLKEAEAIHKSIEQIFEDNFFAAVGALDIMPQNNQVLQKREGYSQIFAAYSMLDLALQLDWKGLNEVYEGESKNVALLYEYWLFFELYKILKSMDGCETVKTMENPFLTENNGLTISLTQGKPSCQSFEMKKYGVKINLYYNRTFSGREFQATIYEGSYSRPFRPDYTLAIFPASFSGRHNGETEAVRDGAVSFIHFDAKYRISELTALFGKETDSAEEDLEEDKAGSVVNTYKRGDLLKMHTYNDAIRRTVGSFVLYPGNEAGQKRGTAFRMYDEILPGVGAFALKPSIDAQGENELKRFLTRLIALKGADESRLNRMRHYTEMVLKEPSIAQSHYEEKTNVTASDARKNNLCVIGYIRADADDDYYFFLKENGLLKVGGEFPFYFYAIKDGDIYSHHKAVFRATAFRFYTNRISETDTYQLEPVLCEIISNELVSKADLVEWLRGIGYDTDEMRHRADFYFLLTVKVVKILPSKDEVKVSDINGRNGNDTFSPHSPKVVCFI